MSHPVSEGYAALIDAVQRAQVTRTPLQICGAGSKQGMFAAAQSGEVIAMTEHSGITSYQPEEMTITARAGTSIDELVAVTAEHNQRLAFEPMRGGGATLGGTLSCNWSGPARPWHGAVRDALLGVTMINGRGELLRFGGRVMKNVAGYDVSRLLCGAMGTLGIIVEATLRLLPAAPGSRTLMYECTAEEAIPILRRCHREVPALSGACWLGGRVYLRLEGSASLCDAAAKKIPVSVSEAVRAPWEALRELQPPALSRRPLWCLSVAPATPLDDPEPRLIDWAGARRYIAREELDDPRPMARAGSGHARLLWGGDHDEAVHTGSPGVLGQLQRRLKSAMDPEGLFNSGLVNALYEGGHWT